MIEGIFHINETDSKKFTATLVQVVAKLQNEKFKVEIQYSTLIKGTIQPEVIYSALIIGRKK